MPVVSSSSVPFLKGVPVADKDASKDAPVVKAEPAAVASPLAPASASGDSAVHKLLAELDIHRRNGDEAGVAAAVAALAELGFAAA